jgi:hypothetical protein
MKAKPKMKHGGGGRKAKKRRRKTKSAASGVSIGGAAKEKKHINVMAKNNGEKWRGGGVWRNGSEIKMAAAAWHGNVKYQLAHARGWRMVAASENKRGSEMAANVKIMAWHRMASKMVVASIESKKPTKSIENRKRKMAK